MLTKLNSAPNCWAVICPEPKAPGVWGIWVRERCVAIGWPPSEYHLEGPTGDSSWEIARARAIQIKRDDIIIPYLMNHTFGVPGIVKRVAIQDAEWKPTVRKGGYAGNRKESELGRRIEVEWLTKGVPPLDEVAVMPEGIRNSTGEVRATIEPVRSKRHTRFMEIIGDRRNWKKYASEKLASPVEAAIKGRYVAGSGVASFLAGHKPYLERAREAFPILVRQAHARETIYYSDLADVLKMPNPRNLNYVLGAIGRAIQKLAAKWREEIPPLQCLVVNKASGMPGEGIGWFISDLKDFSKRTPDEKKQILGIELVKVFNYAKWEEVLGAFGLTPLPADPAIASLKVKAGRMGGVGEQEDHKNLKHYVANNPKVLGLSGFDGGNTEYCFPSADRIDVVFQDEGNGRWVGVEVKGPSSDDADILRGLFQCIKYSALREAELKSESISGSARVVLVLSRKLPAELKELKNLLGVEVIDGIIVPQEINSKSILDTT